MKQEIQAREEWFSGVRGSIREHVALSRVTWFRVGGAAQYLFKPEDAEDLCYFLRNKPQNLPVMAMGVGSNLLIRDGGVDGFVIRLGRAFASIETEGDYIHAGAGALDMNVAQVALDKGIGGVEFLSGIPGTLGGAVAMNAGAYGREIRDVFVQAEAVDNRGVVHTLTLQDMCFHYRGNNAPEGLIFTKVVLRGEKRDKEEIQKIMQEIRDKRESTQPVRTRTGGSTFANPKGEKSAWQLIDEAGCRGLRAGGAKVSEMHCNFLENTGSATAADLEYLGEEVRRRVRERTGVELEWEIRRIGKKGS